MLAASSSPVPSISGDSGMSLSGSVPPALPQQQQSLHPHSQQQQQQYQYSSSFHQQPSDYLSSLPSASAAASSQMLSTSAPASSSEPRSSPIPAAGPSTTNNSLTSGPIHTTAFPNLRFPSANAGSSFASTSQSAGSAPYASAQGRGAFTTSPMADPMTDWRYEMRREAQEILPGLFVGGYQPSRDLELLNRLGITSIVCVSEDREKHLVKPRFIGQFEYMNLEMRDATDQNLIRLFPQ